MCNDNQFCIPCSSLFNEKPCLRSMALLYSPNEPQWILKHKHTYIHCHENKETVKNRVILCSLSAIMWHTDTYTQTGNKIKLSGCSQILLGAFTYRVVLLCSLSADNGPALQRNQQNFISIWSCRINFNLSKYNGKQIRPKLTLKEKINKYIVVFTPNQITPVLHTTPTYLRQINKKAARFH